MAWGLFLSSSRWAFHIPHSEWEPCHWVVIMHRGHIFLGLLQKKMRWVEKKPVFFQTPCVPKNSFHYIHFMRCLWTLADWRKISAVIGFCVFHLVSNRNVILLYVCGQYVYMSGCQPRAPPFSNSLSRIWWKAVAIRGFSFPLLQWK